MTDAKLPPPLSTPDTSRVSGETAPTERTREGPDDKRKRRVELAGAVIIGIAAVLTALAVYQGSGVDGTVQEKNTEAVGLTLLANDAYNDATAEEAKERDWIFSYVIEAVNEQPSAEILLAAMPDEVLALANEWFDANADKLSNPESESIGDPFSADYDSYANLQSFNLLVLGDERAQLARCALFDSEVAGVRGDNYGLATVFLAVALVVGGIAALLRGKAAQIIVLTTAIVSLLIGAGVLALAGDENEARAETAADFFVEDEDGTPLTADQALAVADEQCPETDQ
jgi:hypothetical protein